MYVRWGRKSCPDNTSLVYNGTAAGSHDGAGGISDIFCMPEDPSYNHVVDSVGRSRTLLDNIRYETDEMFSSINEANVPCAVCQSETRSVALLQDQDLLPRGLDRGVCRLPHGRRVQKRTTLSHLHRRGSRGSREPQRQGPRTDIAHVCQLWWTEVSAIQP